jgi:hypothetical protein
VFIGCADFIDNFCRRYALAAFDPPHDRVADGSLPALERGVFHCWRLCIITSSTARPTHTCSPDTDAPDAFDPHRRY